MYILQCFSTQLYLTACNLFSNILFRLFAQPHAEPDSNNVLSDWQLTVRYVVNMEKKKSVYAVCECERVRRQQQK